MKETIEKNAIVAEVIAKVNESENAFIVDATDTSYNAMSSFRRTVRLAKSASKDEIKNAFAQVRIALRLRDNDEGIKQAENEYLNAIKAREILREMKDSELQSEIDWAFEAAKATVKIRKNELQEVKDNFLQKYAGEAINLIMENYYKMIAKAVMKNAFSYGDLAEDAIQTASTKVCRYCIEAYAKKCNEDESFNSNTAFETVLYRNIIYMIKRLWREVYVVRPCKSDNQLKKSNVALKERNKQSFISTDYETEDNEGNSVTFGEMMEDESGMNAIQNAFENERIAIMQEVLQSLSPLNRAIIEGRFLQKKDYRELHDELKAQFKEYTYSDYNGLYYRTQTLLESLREKIRVAML